MPAARRVQGSEGAPAAVESTLSASALRALHELAVAAGGVLHLGSLSQLAIQHAKSLLDVDGAALVVWDSESGRLVMPGTDRETIVERNRRVPGASVISMAYQSRQPVVVEDYKSWAAPEEIAADGDIATTCAVPLVIRDVAMGAFSVWTRAPRKYDSTDVEILSLLAAQVAPAMEAARLYALSDRQRAEAEALAQLMRDGASEPDLERAIAFLTERARKLVGSDYCLLALLEGSNLRWAGTAGTESETFDASPLDPAGPSGRALATGRPQVVRRLGDEPFHQALKLHAREGGKSLIATPMHSSTGRAVGVISFGWRTEVSIHQSQTRLSEAIASFAATIIEEAQGRAVRAAHAMELATSEARFRTLFASMSVGVWVQDPEGRIVNMNQAASAILGIGDSELRGQSTRQASSPMTLLRENGSEFAVEDRPSAMALRTKKAVRDVTMRLARPGLPDLWLRTDAVPVLDPDGELTEVVTTFVDITERVRANAALRENQEHLRAIFERSALGIARIALNGQILEANQALERMLGYEPGEMTGLPLGALAHPDDAEPQLFVDLVSGVRDALFVEHRWRHKEGDYIWGSTTASLVRGPNGDPLFVVGMVEDITTRRTQDEQLKRQALYDNLTDLPNRTLLADRLQQALLSGARSSEFGALLVMDLDRFKEINETLSHAHGDALIKEVAQRLRRDVRESDTVARLGGDEFAVIMPGVVSEAGPGQAARKILKSLEEPIDVMGEKVVVSASIGITLFPLHGDDPGTLLRRSDIAMYVAKRAGSGFAFYTLEADTSSRTRLGLIAELRHAVDHGQLVLHYQPTVDVRTGFVHRAEALVRWQHPSGELLLPDNFIRLAEETGLIRSVANWVLDAALRQCSQWRDAGRHLGVAVNLSARNLHDQTLLDYIGERLRRYRLEPQRLRLEITESALMTDPDRAVNMMLKLAEMGVKLAIDDYGTGYSSLAYLRRLPVDELKIDKSFVMEMAMEENAAVIVRSTVDLGHNLGLVVVAEGVESPKVLQSLLETGCDAIQGFLVSAGLSPDDFEQWLDTRSPDWLSGMTMPPDIA